MPFHPARFLAAATLFAVSCQKSYTIPVVAGIRDTTIIINGQDTAIPPPANGPLLVRSVSVWQDSPTTPPGSGVVTEYFYDKAKFLVKKHLAGYPAEFYNRDANERLTGITFDGNPAYTKVYYSTTNYRQVAYLILGKDATSKPDSMTFIYYNGHAARTDYYAAGAGARQLQWYQTYSYDSTGNVTQLQLFVNNQFNIGYTYTYDNKINPLYVNDDARLPYGGGYLMSPNNIVKQVNHYGAPATDPDDYVTYTFYYDAGNKPVNELHAGTALGTQTETIKFYYQ